jgi:hypothetical protein
MPQARHHRLVVREFERKPTGVYRAKVAADLPSPPSAPVVRPSKPAVIKPPIPGVDRQPTPLETQRRRKRARLAALKWLRETFPQLFHGDVVLPLAIGVGRELIARAIASERWPSRTKARDDIGAAVCYWTGSLRYLEALAEPGAMRHGLDGQPVGGRRRTPSRGGEADSRAQKGALTMNDMTGRFIHPTPPVPPAPPRLATIIPLTNRGSVRIFKDEWDTVAHGYWANRYPPDGGEDDPDHQEIGVEVLRMHHAYLQPTRIAGWGTTVIRAWAESRDPDTDQWAEYVRVGRNAWIALE